MSVLTKLFIANTLSTWYWALVSNRIANPALPQQAVVCIIIIVFIAEGIRSVQRPHFYNMTMI